MWSCEHRKLIIKIWLGSDCFPLHGSCLPARGIWYQIWGSPVEQSWYGKFVMNWGEFCWECWDGHEAGPLAMWEKLWALGLPHGGRMGSLTVLTRILLERQRQDLYWKKDRKFRLEDNQVQRGYGISLHRGFSGQNLKQHEFKSSPALLVVLDIIQRSLPTWIFLGLYEII